MGSLAIVTSPKTARLGPAFTPLQIEYQRLEAATSSLALPAPLLRIICSYASTEPHEGYELLEYLSGDWQGTVYLGTQTGRLGAIILEIPAAPFQMKVRLRAMFQISRGRYPREICKLNYSLVEKSLDMENFAYPGHWIMPVMFPK